MKFTVYPGSSQSQTLTGNIAGFEIAAKIVHGTTNVAFDTDDKVLDTTQINLTCTARIGGENVNIFNGPLGALAFPGNYWRDSFRHIWGYEAKIMEQVAEAVGVACVKNAHYYIQLPTCVNLDGDDQLTLSVTVASGAFHDDASTTSSYISVSAVEAMAPSEGVPVIDVIPIGSNESQFQVQRENLKSIYFAHIESSSTADFDVEGITDANAIVTQVNLSSKIFSYSANFLELITRRAAQFVGETNAFSRGQSFCLYNGPYSLPGAKVSMSFNSSNVTGGENFVVISYIRPSTYVTRNSQRIANKILSERQLG